MAFMEMEAQVGMLVVETIAMSRRPILFMVSRSKRSAENLMCRGGRPQHFDLPRIGFRVAQLRAPADAGADLSSGKIATALTAQFKQILHRKKVII